MSRDLAKFPSERGQILVLLVECGRAPYLSSLEFTASNGKVSEEPSQCRLWALRDVLIAVFQ